MEFHGVNGKYYKTIEPALGKGGEGSVYRIENMPNFVLKMFSESKRTESRHRKLLAMIDTPIEKNALQQITWPTDVVYLDGNFVGYIMPLIKNNEDLNVMYSDKYNCTLSEKITIAQNLCAAVNAVHEAGQVCGDLNPKNICVDPHNAIVTLVDTDSYHITDINTTQIFRCEVGLPEYLPREIQEKMKNGATLATAPLPTFTKHSDLFALAVHIFALLMNGCHPFACAVDNLQSSISHMSISKPSVAAPQPIENICDGFFPFYQSKDGITVPVYAPKFEYLPDDIQTLFVKAFVDGHANPNARPNAVEWYQALEIMKSNLKKCGTDSTHMFPKHNKDCPWCAINNKMSSFSAPKISQISVNTHQNYTNGNANTKTTSTYSTTRSKNKWIAPVCIGVALLLLIIGIKSCSSKSNQNSSGYYDGTQYSEPTNNDFGIGDNTESNNTNQYIQNKKTLSIPAIKDNICNVNAIETKSSQIGLAEIVKYTGKISNNKQVDTYSYTVVRDGSLRFEISELKNNSVVSLAVYDSSGEYVASDSYCYNGEGVTIKSAKKGTQYSIKVKYTEGYPDYLLSICQPKDIVNISNLTEVNDSIQFTNQKNEYYFKVPIDGKYRFEISNMMNGVVVGISAVDRLDNTVASDSYCYNGEGVTLKGLKAGEEYRICVTYCENFGNYKLLVGCQKEQVDISNYTLVCDSIQFTDQSNDYYFIAPLDGRYRFEMSEIQSGFVVGLYAYNSLNEEIASDSYCYNGEGITLKSLKAGEKYRIQVKQNENSGTYKLIVGQQKSTADISSFSVVNDEVQYTDQRNVYYITANTDSLVITVSGLKSNCAVELYAFNDLGEELSSDSYCYNGEYITMRNLVSGKVYEIQVRQTEGFSTYALTIE